MTRPVQPAAGGFPRFAAEVVGATVLAALLGFAPTRSLAGPGGVAAMWAGCGVAAAASLLGGVPIALARGVPAERTKQLLAAMVLRLVLVFVLGGAVFLSGWFDRRPLLLWIAIGHLALLVVDTRYALRAQRT
jgi:hypothetical protein